MEVHAEARHRGLLARLTTVALFALTLAGPMLSHAATRAVFVGIDT